MPDLELKKPQRQSPVGVGVIFFQKLRIAINIFISVAVVQFGFKANLSSVWFISIIVAILLLVLLVSFLTYRKFYFYVEDENFVVEKGLLRRDKITIAFERIQSVHIDQNLVQRILGVVGLKIDTAGSATKELEIAALPKGYARLLQEYLVEKKSVVAQEESEDENISEIQTTDKTDLIKKTPLVRLNLLEVLKVGLTENHLKRGLILLAIINGYVFQYQEYLLNPFESYLKDNSDYFIARWIVIVPVALLLFFVVATILSIFDALLRYYGLKFFVDSKGVQLVAGLLKRAESQIPVNKIQYIKWSTNPLRKLIGLKTIVVKQAGSNVAGDKQSLKVPGSRDEQLETVLNEFFPERNNSPFKRFSSHSFFRTQILVIFSLLPAIVLLGLWFTDESHLIFIAPLWLVLSIPFAYKYACSMHLECNEDVIQLKKGWIFPKTEIIKYYKLQNLRLHQNVFQKKRKTVHLDFYTAAGNLRMWELNEGVAQELYNYILYKVESSNQNWM